MEQYVTFGQSHAHIVNGVIFDKDTVAVFDAPTAEAGREIAFKLFGPKFCFHYFGDEFDHTKLHYFPSGLVYVPEMSE